MHICPDLNPSYLLPARLALTLILALLVTVSGLAACAPLSELSRPASEDSPLPSEPAAIPHIFRKPLSIRPSESPQKIENTDEPSADVSRQTPEHGALSLPISPEISELAQINPWEVLPLLSTGEETETYDFPVTINEQVEYYIDFFTNRHRKTFARWLARSARYLPMIKEEFAKAGLPLDLAYLPMIESGFNTTATSRASAVGTWQFMRATGRDYGLTVNNYVDERRDPIKSTKAAAAYLAKLYRDFDSWHLAVAAYNAGEGRIKKAMKQSDKDDFWDIAKSQYIHPETKLYVPQLIAAIMIAKDPGKYGFTDIEYENPLEYDIVHVPGGMPIKAVAVACDLPEEKILALNRHLSKAVTPPSETEYPLRVPPGTRELVAKNLPRVRRVTVTEINIHEVGKGETLTTISKKYRLSKTALLKANNLEQERLSLGQHIRIPVQSSGYRISDEPVNLEKAGNYNIPLISVRTETEIHPPARKEARKEMEAAPEQKNKGKKNGRQAQNKSTDKASKSTKEKSVITRKEAPKKPAPALKKDIGVGKKNVATDKAKEKTVTPRKNNSPDKKTAGKKK